MRAVDRVEGLALLGTASIGPLPLALPAVLDTSRPPLPPLGPGLGHLAATAGERRLRWEGEATAWEVTLPVLAPEIAPAASGVYPTSEGRVALLHPPFAPGALESLRSTEPELLVLGNARTLWNEGQPLVEAVAAIRETLGAEPVVWAPRVALPHRLPLLAYLGLDVVDTTEGMLQAASGTFFDLALGAMAGTDSTTVDACDCDGCRSGGPGARAEHTRRLFARSLAETRRAIRRGVLRELVEARLAAEPANVEILRYADRLLAPLLDDRSPVTGAGRHTYVLTESHRRPEMERFRRRFLERYRPPPSKSVLLLVPCSRTKPYRVSPSHRRFFRALDGLPGVERVHMVSVSSPLGLVPRELEDVPPARHYDVPVTGDWSASEQEVVRRGLAHLLGHGRYRAVVLHLDPTEYSFLRDTVPSGMTVVSTVEDHRTTAGSALDRLRKELGTLLASHAPVPGGFRTTAIEEFAALASVQFGVEAAARLVQPPARLMGRPWFLRLTDGHQDLATVREERGLLHLTRTGAARLGELLPRVDAEPSLGLHGDLFVPGVRGANPSVRIGDSVGIFQDGTLRGVGEAALSSRLMRELHHGIAVKVRHHLPAPADTDNTSEPRGEDPGR